MAEPGVELGRAVRDHCVNVRYPKDAEAGAGVSVLGDAALMGGMELTEFGDRGSYGAGSAEPGQIGVQVRVVTW